MVTQKTLEPLVVCSSAVKLASKRLSPLLPSDFTICCVVCNSLIAAAVLTVKCFLDLPLPIRLYGIVISMMMLSLHMLS